jgi:transposase
MELVCVGLDVGTTVSEVVAIDKATGARISSEKFQTSAQRLISALDRIPGRKEVHLEASELAAWVRRMVQGRVARVVVSHPKSNAWIAKDPLKSDSVDAYKLAELLRMGQFREVHYAEEQTFDDFKRMVHHYDELTCQEVRLKVRIKAEYRQQGGLFRGSRVFGEDQRGEFLRTVPSVAVQAVLRELYTLLDQTLKTREAARSRLRTMARQQPVIGRLQKVPGVGLLGASRFFAYIQTPHRFPRREQLWRYCQMGITNRSSNGLPLGRQRIDHNGNGGLKQMSRTAFLGALKSDNRIRRAYLSSLARTQNKDHARLNVQRKILTLLWTLWKNGNDYQENHTG